MTNAAVRVGVAGLGTMGRNHLRNLAGRADVRLVAVADPSERARLAAAADHPDTRVFADPLDLLADSRPDALIIAAPTRAHHDLAIAALREGVAVLVEKPLAASVTEGRELVNAVSSSGGFLQVGHVERFNPAVQVLVARLQGGALSRVLSIKTVRQGPLPERIRDVGVAVDLATHDVDLMCLVLDERPVRAYAEATQNVHTAHEDLLFGLLSFEGGAVGLLDVNWLSPQKLRTMAVLGPEGLFEVDYLHQTLTSMPWPSDESPDYVGGYAPTYGGSPVDLSVERAEPLARELDAFFDAVRSGGPSPVTALDGLWALALAEALLASSAAGRSVAIEGVEA